MNEIHGSEGQTPALLLDGLEAHRPTDGERALARQRLFGEEAENARAARSGVVRRRSLFGGALAVAAGLVAFVGLSARPALTLEQVRVALSATEWIHVVFDNGEEHWISPAHDIQARIAPAGDYRVFIDRGTGTRWAYWQGGASIHRDSVGQLDLGSDAWDSVVGPLSRRAEEGREGRWTVERHDDEVDGTKLVRFDSYTVDGLDERILTAQLWADPGTRLPVRLRERRDYGRRENGDGREWVAAKYQFPDEGPRSIYDLGAPEGLPVSVEDGSTAPEPDVAEVLDAYLAARARFLENYRVVSWQPLVRDGELHVLHRRGRPELKDVGTHGYREDFRGAQARYDYYFDLGPRQPEHHMANRATAESVLEWTAGQTPVAIHLWDGERSFSRNGPLPAVFEEQDTPVVRVVRTPGDIGFPDHVWPVEAQWPLALHPRTAEVVLLEAAVVPAGQIGIRWTRGGNRDELVLDPERDHICVRRVRSTLVDGEWRGEQETELDDLRQLATGHWVAETVRDRRRVGGDPLVFRNDVTPLPSAGFEAGLFDGKALVERAEAEGYTIEGD